MASFAVLMGCGAYGETPDETLPKEQDTKTDESVLPVNENPVSDDGATQSPDIEMEIINFAFSPQTITVPVGTTVIWSNSDAAPHTVTTRDPLFDSGRVSTGDLSRYTFEKPGTYEYYCTIHPYMTATVVVE